MTPQSATPSIVSVDWHALQALPDIVQSGERLRYPFSDALKKLELDELASVDAGHIIIRSRRLLAVDRPWEDSFAFFRMMEALARVPAVVTAIAPEIASIENNNILGNFDYRYHDLKRDGLLGIIPDAAIAAYVQPMITPGQFRLPAYAFMLDDLKAYPRQLSIAKQTGEAAGIFAGTYQGHWLTRKFVAVIAWTDSVRIQTGNYDRQLVRDYDVFKYGDLHISRSTVPPISEPLMRMLLQAADHPGTTEKTGEILHGILNSGMEFMGGVANNLRAEPDAQTLAREIMQATKDGLSGLIRQAPYKAEDIGSIPTQNPDGRPGI